MLRRRLLWFTLGFGVTGAGISHFMLRDLWADRHTLSTKMEEQFGALETRVLYLESVANQTSQLAPAQDGNSGAETGADSS